MTEELKNEIAALNQTIVDLEAERGALADLDDAASRVKRESLRPALASVRGQLASKQAELARLEAMNQKEAAAEATRQAVEQKKVRINQLAAARRIEQECWQQRRRDLAEQHAATIKALESEVVREIATQNEQTAEMARLEMELRESGIGVPSLAGSRENPAKLAYSIVEDALKKAFPWTP